MDRDCPDFGWAKALEELSDQRPNEHRLRRLPLHAGGNRRGTGVEVKLDA
jgi:hypothetical protein